MARRERSRLDALLDAWAAWCVQGTAVRQTSMLGVLIDSQGVLIRGTAGGSCMPMAAHEYEMEERAEYAVVALAREDLLAADVIRLEYNAGVSSVIRRRKLRGYDHRNIGQLEKAHALGVGVATYRRRLAKARAHIQLALAL